VLSSVNTGVNTGLNPFYQVTQCKGAMGTSGVLQITGSNTVISTCIE